MSKLHIIVAFCLSLLCWADSSWSLSSATGAREEDQPYIPSILIVDEDVPDDSLREMGIVVWGRRADMVLALVPRSSQAGMQRARGVRHFEPGQRRTPLMDVARTWYGADAIGTGTGFPQAYTGDGVVVGLVDTGLDPMHVEFLDHEGRTRVKRTVWLDELTAAETIATGPEQIAAAGTDNAGEWHGTHVAGIMAGSYSEGKYYGMAPGADIVMAGCQLYDAGILAACERILDYAREVGKPAVINLSLGSYNGPHDGSSLFCRYISLIGREAIVCMSAGNEGQRPGNFGGVIDGAHPDWRGVFCGNDWLHYVVQGVTDVWADDERPLQITLQAVDRDTDQVLGESGPFGNDGEFDLEIPTSSLEGFEPYISGTVGMHGYVSPLNGRWVTEIYYQVEAPASSLSGAWARHRLGLKVSDPAGSERRFRVFADCIYSRLEGVPGYPGPGTDWSVSDIATGDNVICVGMYNSRETVPWIGAPDVPLPEEVGTVARKSGYATLDDGRVLPHTVAPGGRTISAVSTYYADADGAPQSFCNATQQINGRDYYWTAASGTSMSSPYLAGVVATWLEADPNLGIDDVQEILEITARHDHKDPSDPRHGRGWLDPAAGLHEVLLRAGAGILSPGVESPADQGLRMTFTGRVLEVCNPGGAQFTLRICDMKGRFVTEYPLSGAWCTIPLHLEPGIYIATAGKSYLKLKI